VGIVNTIPITFLLTLLIISLMMFALVMIISVTIRIIARLRRIFEAQVLDCREWAVTKILRFDRLAFSLSEKLDSQATCSLKMSKYFPRVSDNRDISQTWQTNLSCDTKLAEIIICQNKRSDKIILNSRFYLTSMCEQTWRDDKTKQEGSIFISLI
jgi:hypothetical protein